jgi:HlyD family secretion protein/epimerase transport system membrane fusion protein
VIAVAFGGAGSWGATVPLASAVVAAGQVTVDTNRKQISHLEGGVVADLRVRNGDTVEPGDVLMRLDETRATAQLAILASAYREELARQARLIAERDGRVRIAWPPELNDSGLNPDIAALRASQSAIFDSRRDTLLGEAAILNERVDQLGQEIEGMAAQRAATDKQITFIAEELGPLRDLFSRGHTTKQRLLALEREAARLSGQRGQLTADIARARKAVGETKLEILQNEKAFRAEVVSRLREVQAKLIDLRERRIAAADVLQRLDVRAPVSGKVVNMTVHSTDAVIKAGSPVLEIVPSGDELLVEVRVRTQDVDNVAIGQSADIRFLAFKQRTTPVLSGQVAYVSADALSGRDNAEAFYLARIRVPDAELARLGGQKLQPGMPAEAMILTGKRTALDYMIQPIRESMNRAWREE